MRITSPRFHLKSRTQFTRSELPTLYEEYREKLKSSLKKVSDISVSFDCWTDSARKHEYLAFIGHFVEDDKPVYRVLEVIDVSEKSHTGTFLAEKMKSSIDFFELNSKIRACVRDGAPNAKSASVQICEVNFDCFAHKLNLAAKAGTSGFTGLDKVLEKLKKTCKTIRMSSNLRREWDKIFDQLESPVLMLKKHIDIRWTSLNDVLKRALFVKDQLDLFLQEQECLDEITDAEWKTIQNVIDLLKPLDDAFSLVQAKDFTCSSIIPLCKVIIEDFESIKKNVTAKEKIVEKLNDELKKYEKLEYLNMATLLDVRYKDEHVNDSWKAFLLDKMIDTVENTEEVIVDMNTNQKVESSNPFTRFRSKKVKKSNAVPSGRKSVIVGEHDRWISEPTDEDLSPIAFWSRVQNQHAFPTLFSLHQKYFCTPATSVETERLFSTARVVLTDNRKCLSAENFSMLLFYRETFH